MRRTAEGPLDGTLPALEVGTFEHRGVVFLKARDLLDWLADCRDELAPTDPAYGLLAEVRWFVAEAGGLR